MAVPTYPITLPADGTRIDPQWGIDVTNGVNDHETRIDTLETQFTPQISYSTNGTLATSNTSTEAAMTAWTGGNSASFLFKAGWVHEVNVQGGCADNGTSGFAGRVIVRVRKGLNTTSGTQLALHYQTTRGNSLSVVNFSFTRYVKNATGADITSACGLTIQANMGGTTAVIYGDADTPLMLTIKPIGTTANLPQFANIAAAIT
jgi:hypothetical protein